VIQVDWETSTYDNYTVTPDEAEDQISTGKSSRKVAFVAIGLVGALMLVLPGRQRVSYVNLPFALLCMYILVCMASFIWTDTTWLTSKRLGIGIFSLLAIIGAIKHLSTRDVIDATLGIGTILLAVSIYAELRLGTFTPLVSEYRFAGIVHPNAQGSACGLMVIAAFFWHAGVVVALQADVRGLFCAGWSFLDIDQVANVLRRVLSRPFRRVVFHRVAQEPSTRRSRPAGRRPAPGCWRCCCLALNCPAVRPPPPGSDAIPMKNWHRSMVACRFG